MSATGSTRRRRSPRQYSEEDRERLIREQANSGLTKKAFCEREGVNLGTFHGWSKYRRTVKSKPRFAEVDVATSAPPVVEILLPNGARIGIRPQGKRDDLVALIRGVAGC